MIFTVAIDRNYAGFYGYRGPGGFRLVLGYIAFTLIYHCEDVFIEATKQLIDVALEEA